MWILFQSGQVWYSRRAKYVYGLLKAGVYFQECVSSDNYDVLCEVK
jgi:hypothetical protein